MLVTARKGMQTMAGGTSLRARVVGAALRRYREMTGYQMEDAGPRPGLRLVQDQQA